MNIVLTVEELVAHEKSLVQWTNGRAAALVQAIRDEARNEAQSFTIATSGVANARIAKIAEKWGLDNPMPRLLPAV